MESIEESAKTVNDAIAKALARLGKSREEVEISVLSEGSRGILGIGGEEARILVSVRPEVPPEAGKETEEIAKKVVEALLEAMQIPAQVEVRSWPEAGPGEITPLLLDIRGRDLGILIGRRGETLTSLQFLVNLIVGHRLQYWPRLVVDVEGYRSRREQALRNLARRTAERVRASRRPVALEAMPAHERRIVHLALQGHPYVITESVGEGESRRVVISPKS